MDTKVCFQCGIEKPLTAFGRSGYKDANGNVKYRHNRCKPCLDRKERVKARLALFESFGCKCQCCGETHPDFLTLEHIGGLGGKERRNRKTNRRITTQEIYHARKHGFDPEFYSLLCMNCNFARGHWGKCPHETGVTPEQAIAKMRDQAKLPGHQFRDKSKSKAGWFKPGFDGRRGHEQETVQ
jgi:hypothetical protein